MNIVNKYPYLVFYPNLTRFWKGCIATNPIPSKSLFCIGNFIGTKPLYRIVQEMTLAAATRDRRFAPVQASELEYIDIEISVLTPLTRINSIDEFRIGQHGIYMTKNGKSGTYLPQVAEETGWSKEKFLSYCCAHKAGLAADAWRDPETEVYLFTAEVFGAEVKEI